MFPIKLPQGFIATPLDERILDFNYDRIPNQATNDIEYTDGNEMLKVGTGLLDLDELLYLIVQYGHDHHVALNRFEASTVLWLMVHKDLLHANRFLPTEIQPEEFVDPTPYAPFDILANAVKSTYATTKPTTKITKVKPIETHITNPDKISDQTLRQTYWQPIYDFYVDNCQGDINGTDIVPAKSAPNLPFTYRPNIHCYSLSLQNWLNNNLPIAVSIVTNNSIEILDTTAIINKYTELETKNPRTHGPGSIRVIKAEQLRHYQPLIGHRKSVQQIIKFLNI